jgi:Leucine-rich repeat (LRR) protein
MERAKHTLSEKLSRSKVLKQHYYTPAECQIPSLKKKDPVHQALQVRRDRSNQEEEQKDQITIDGFYLLEVTGMGFPEDVRQALLVDKKLNSVVEDDLHYFTEMLYIDASENNLQLAPFGAFPKLRELRLACNHISFIDQELFGFENLTSLDLSYNRLTVECVQALDVLPNLKDLDLSGNKLKEVPDDWQHFRVLEKLLLDYNLFENNDIFVSISSAPNLRHLSVYDNHLSQFPELALSFEGFR